MSARLSKDERLEALISELDWPRLAVELDEHGYALTEQLLEPSECAQLISSYASDELFRSRVVMQRHNFGRGEYRYFAEPLPQLVSQLRELFYPPLARIANTWAERLRQDERYPPALEEFLVRCGEGQQLKP